MKTKPNLALVARLQIQPVEHGFLEHLLVRPDDLAELLQLAQRDEASDAGTPCRRARSPGHSRRWSLVVLLRGPLRRSSSGGTRPLGCIGCSARLSRGVGLALCDVHDVVLAATPEFVPLRVSDHIVGRCDALTHVADDAGIEPKRFERLHFHCCGPIVLSESIWSMSWRGAERRRIPKRDSWRVRHPNNILPHGRRRCEMRHGA